MEPKDFKRRVILGVAGATVTLLLAGALPSRSIAQIATAPPTPAGGRHLVVAPYGWMAGIAGDTGVRDLSTELDVSFFDLLDHLRFAAMGSVEGGYGPWLAGVDAIYTSVEVEHLRSLTNAQIELVLSSKLLITNLYAGYSFDSDDVAVDILLGARVWAVDMGLNVATAQASAERQHDGSWIDGFIGARGRWQAAEKWQFSLAGNGGGGGSENSADILVTGGYDVSSRWSLFLALRYLHLKRVKDDLFFFDGHMLGPAVGAVYRFF